MGYYIWQRAGDVFIPADQQEAALAAIKAAIPEALKRGAGGGSYRTGFQSEAEAQAALDEESEWRRPACKIEHGTSYALRIPHIGFGDDEVAMKADTLAEALSAMRWDADQNENGDIVGLEFTGEKSSGDDDVALAAIAPFVRSNFPSDNLPYIEMQGEQGEMWRWIFVDGEVREVEPTITWP